MRNEEIIKRLRRAIERNREEANMDDRAAANSKNSDAAATFKIWAIHKRRLADDIEALLGDPR